MQNPTNLRVLAVAEELVVEVYELTRRFPHSERFGLSSQLRRAAVSVGSNVAEGCGRSGEKALLAYVFIALGSASEVEFQLRIAVRLGFTTTNDAETALNLTVDAKRMLARLAVALKKRAEV
jgi:four helix bundle protein